MSWTGGKREWSGSRGARAEPDEFSRTTAGKGARDPGPEKRRSGHGYAAMGSTNERRSEGSGGRIPRLAVRIADSIEEYVRVLLRLSMALLVVFLGLQFVRPELRNPPVTADLQAPLEVKQILKNSCYSCHSNETTLEWFDKVAPVYWLVTSDV